MRKDPPHVKKKIYRLKDILATKLESTKNLTLKLLSKVLSKLATVELKAHVGLFIFFLYLLCFPLGCTLILTPLPFFIAHAEPIICILLVLTLFFILILYYVAQKKIFSFFRLTPLNIQEASHVYELLSYACFCMNTPLPRVYLSTRKSFVAHNLLATFQIAQKKLLIITPSMLHKKRADLLMALLFSLNHNRMTPYSFLLSGWLSLFFPPKKNAFISKKKFLLGLFSYPFCFLPYFFLSRSMTQSERYQRLPPETPPAFSSYQWTFLKRNIQELHRNPHTRRHRRYKRQPFEVPFAFSHLFLFSEPSSNNPYPLITKLIWGESFT